MQTLMLIQSQVKALLDPASLVEPLRAGFISYSANQGERALRARSALPGPGTATVLFPGTAPDVPAYTVKVHAKFPNENPAIRGVLCLHNAANGDLLAIMDSSYLTAVRTGIAGALAADVLARRDTDAVAVIGTGTQGTHQLRALVAMRPVRNVRAYDVVPQRAEAFARAMAGELAIPVSPSPSVAEAVRTSGIVLVATWSKTPFILPGMLSPGTHVTTLGADEPGKAEVSADVIRTGLFVCDDRALAAELGALRGVGLGAEAADAELGEVLAGTHPGRTSQDQITIYAGVGLAFQDAVAAWQVYQAARSRGVGEPIDFLA